MTHCRLFMKPESIILAEHFSGVNINFSQET